MQRPIAISSFKDNYIWLIRTDAGCWVIDPGDAAPVMAWLHEHGQRLAGILLTHHHADHVGGANTLAQHFECPVWGPDECRTWRTHAVQDESLLTLPGLGRVRVISIAAHTRGHVAYHMPEPSWLFCGDTLFSAGCGRLFEGTAADLQLALARINSLPAETLLFPAHEYTGNNLRFAHHVEPHNRDIADAIDEVRHWRDNLQPSLPTSLARERLINPFLRTHNSTLRDSVASWSEQPFVSDTETLRLLRCWKDQF